MLDEFALVLHLRDVYWSERGRLSVEVIALAIGLIGLLVLGFLPFGVEGVAYQDTVGRWTYVGTILLNGVLVVVTLAKGRVWLGLFGLLLPVLALLGAVLIAKPNSLWARRRYPVGSRKRARAEARAARHDARWRERRVPHLRRGRRPTGRRRSHRSAPRGGRHHRAGRRRVGRDRSDAGGRPAPAVTAVGATR